MKLFLLVYLSTISQFTYEFSYKIKNQGMFVKHYAPDGNKVQKSILSFKIKVNATM